ncbi:S41 family peptidase [Chromatocurvus halotolerans]|nr:S41 family peptidase [Chromatocurvus halotolerans]
MQTPRLTRLRSRALWLLCAGGLLACQLATPAFAKEGESTYALDDLRTFADVFNQIRQGYVEEIDDSTLLQYAIEGMLSGLDPHSVYLTSDAFDDLQTSTSGEFSGLGLEVGMENGLLRVIAPIDGSPAAEAGVQPGDIILKLDNNPLKGMSLSDAVGKMRGPKGSEIELTIGRSGESQPLTLNLTRDVIKVASVRERWLEDGYAYVRVSQFQKSTGDDVAKALEALKKDHELKGVVLDLRNNPGGVLGASVDVAGLFMRGGEVVYTEGRLPNAGQSYGASDEDITNGAPIVVLINRGSASASEIVAGALQDHGRAIIMGTDSFGKGSVQTVMPISETRAVKLTTALYFTPGGRSIQAAGIVPDIRVDRARVTAIGEEGRISEADLIGHLGNGDGEERRKIEASELQSRDNQLYEALTLLKGVNILGMNRSRPTAATLARQARSDDN